MKRAFLALLLAAGVSLAAALPATADPVGDEQPACGDLSFFADQVIFWKTLAPEGTPLNSVEGTVSLAEPACKNVKYTFYVSYISDGKEKVRSLTVHGDGESQIISFLVTKISPDEGSTPCVWFESARGSNVIDRAPDEGCVPTLVDPEDFGGGSSQFS